MVKKFKEEYKNEHVNKPSGSASNSKQKKWVHFNEMLFMVPHIQHQAQLSSLDDSPDELNTAENDKNNKMPTRIFKKQKRNNDYVDDINLTFSEIKSKVQLLSSRQDSLSNNESKVGRSNGSPKIPIFNPYGI